MISRLFRLVGRGSKLDVAHLSFVIYSRKACTCCHKALDLLNGYQRLHHFSVEEIDVDSDPLLAHEYGLHVPVITVNDKVRFKGRIDPALLDRLLVGESRGH